MMTSTFYGIPNYSNAISAPYKSYQVNPVTNLMYNATASKVYAQNFAKKIQSSMSSYLSTLNSSISDLKASSKAFTAKGADSSFNKKSISSTDSSAITGVAASNADAAAYTLNIKKLATAQSNTGVQLSSSAKSSFMTGLNTFSLKVDAKEAKNISFTVNENDTNKSSLENMAKAINYAKTGVTANVVSDSKTGTSYLKLTSDKTGTGSSFSIGDITGNAVSASGAGTVSTQAQNAEYTLESKSYTSQENTVRLNNGKVSITFGKAEGKDIKIAVGTDTKAIQSDVKNLVDSYNSIINFANESSKDISGASKLKGELNDIIKSRQAALQRVGISLNNDGTLSINGDKLEKSINEHLTDIKDIFGGYNGIGERLYTKSNDVLSSPLKYSKPEEINKDYNSFYNYMVSSNRNLNTQNLYRGMVVDTLL